MVAAASPQALVDGLRALRKERLLCDAVLVLEGPGGEERLFVHQAVLAAVSPPLHSLIQENCANEGVGPQNGGPPQPLELRLAGIAEPAAMKAALDQAYAEDHIFTNTNLNKAFQKLGRGLQLADLGKVGADRKDELKQALTSGLQKLRRKGLLCDMHIVAAGARVAVHQVVMAAASPTFRAGVMGGLPAFVATSDCLDQSCNASFTQQETQDLVSQSVELELDGIEHPSALHGVLNHIYDGAGVLTDYRTSFGVNCDVLRLALAFELPLLREAAENCLVESATAENGAECLALCDQLPVGDLGKRIKQRLPASVPATHPGQNKVAMPPAQPDEAHQSTKCAKGKAAHVNIAPPSVHTATLAPVATTTPSALNPPRRRGKPMKASKEAGASQPAEPLSQGDSDEKLQPDAEEGPDLEKYRTVQCVRYASEQVPEPPDPQVMGSHSSKDNKLISQLQRMFMERPVWLEHPLLKALPPNLEYDTLMRLLPFVAYQWADGPWQHAYVMLGWDPREYAEDAKWLQVIQFRDPFFKKNSMAADNDAEPDCTFRRPPTLRVQPYQFCDIKDDFVSNLVNEAVVEDECQKKTGWLPELIFEVVKERLTIKSEQQRERAAKKEESKSCRGKTAGAPKAKRARAGGGG